MRTFYWGMVIPLQNLETYLFLGSDVHIPVAALAGFAGAAAVGEGAAAVGKRFAGLGGSGGGTSCGDVSMGGSACEGGGGGSGLCFVLTRFTTVAWKERNSILPSILPNELGKREEDLTKPN